MALYLYEGDSFNAALAAAALIPGGAMLAIGVGKGIKALATMARAGAPGLRAAIGGSRVVQGLARAGGAVSRVVSSVRTRISRLIGKGDDVGRHADDVDAWRVPGTVEATRVEHGTQPIGKLGEVTNPDKLSTALGKANRPGAGWEAHHICPGGAPGAGQCREILERYNVGINSRVNGVYLPHPGKGALNPDGFVTHPATMVDDYANWVNRVLGDAGSQRDVLDRLDYIRGELQAGRVHW